MGKREMWPTPVCSDANGGVSERAWNGYSDDEKRKRLSNLSNAVVYRYPTPGTTGLSNGSGNCEKANKLYEAGKISNEERMAFRAGNGKGLNVGWVEALMLWPQGWISLAPMKHEAYQSWMEKASTGTLWTVDPADLHPFEKGYIPRTEKSKPSFKKEKLIVLGNGQVPSCAAFAETILGGIA